MKFVSAILAAVSFASAEFREGEVLRVPDNSSSAEERRLGWYTTCGSYFCQGYPFPCYLIRHATYCADGTHSFCGSHSDFRWCSGKRDCHTGDANAYPIAGKYEDVAEVGALQQQPQQNYHAAEQWCGDCYCARNYGHRDIHFDETASVYYEYEYDQAKGSFNGHISCYWDAEPCLGVYRTSGLHWESRYNNVCKKGCSKTKLKKNLANKIFGYLARCEFWLKLRW